MADFKAALARVIDNEGGYRLHKVDGDPGGMTYAGISRRRWPDWPGWAVIDRDGPDAVPADLVAEFYHRNFWRPVCGDLLPCQAIAEAVFDYAVNAGVVLAVKTAQNLVGVAVDGVCGARTAAALKEVEPRWFLAAYGMRRVAYYAALCQKRPGMKKFLLGWVNRAVRMSKQC